MRTRVVFDTGFAGLARVIGVVVGFAVGSISTGCVDAMTTAEADQELRAQVTLDRRFAAEDVQTASVCNGGAVRCFAHVHATEDGFVAAAAAPTGFGATDLEAAYAIPATPATSGAQTVAIVDAFGYSSLEADLATYRSQYGLPACTTANGCLKIVNQAGAATLPAQAPTTDDWTIETALDVDMASAGCPKCKILVVQADDDTGNGLQIAQNTAASLGATVISDSWGSPEQAGQSLDAEEAFFDHPNVAVFVAAGDNGYDDAGSGPDYPGTSAYTIAVGGTRLSKSTGSARGWTEVAWTSGGSACSLSIAKPGYQTSTGCAFKATTDIAAVADPQTGVAVYNTRNGGWTVVGGTSAAAPLVAAIFADTGNGAQTSGEFVKANAAKLNNVLEGSNGTCTNTVLCKAGIGWDGPTGYGSPNGTALVVTAVGTGSGSGSSVNPDGGGSAMGSGTSDDDDNAVIGGCSSSNASTGGPIAFVALFAALLRRRRR
jgi:MYXO-CTERM domain-containing protein